MFRVAEKAGAKINLFLEITGKREDGYHDIDSVMAETSLCDFVTVEVSEQDGIQLESIFEIGSDFEEMAALGEKENLAYKAAELFFDEYGGGSRNIKITIEKRIPVCAGLGGGSADAAAVLRALNALCGSPFTAEELCALGLKLGADVPFCVRGGVCLCRGIGGELFPIETDMNFHGLIVREKAKKLSTAAAYRTADAQGERLLKSSDAMVRAIERKDLSAVADKLYNAFEAACSYGGTASEIMKSHGALGAALSGAGPAYFGLFDDEDKRNAAKAALESAGYTAYIF